MSIKLLLLVVLCCHNNFIVAHSVLGNIPDDILPVGKNVVEVGGFKTYITSPADYWIVVLIISDVFGYDNPKLRYIADKMSITEFYVVVPDLFGGDPVKRNVTSRPLEASDDDRSMVIQAVEDTKHIIKSIRSLYKIKFFGVAGFGWGAKVAAELSKSTDFVEVQILLEPSFVSVDDIKARKVATAILDVENSSSSIKKFEKALKAKPKIDSYVKIFTGVKRGWALRYDDKNKDVARSAEQTIRLMASWLATHLQKLL